MFDSKEIFTGFMHLIDKENDVVFAKKIDRGVVDEKLFFDKAFRNKTVTNKMIEDCVTYLVYNYIDWYKITSSGIEKSSTQLVSVNYETTCYTYFLPGGGEPTGGGTGGNGDATVYDCGDPVHGCINKVKNMLDDCGDGFTKDENGICAPEQIINNLTSPCASAIFTQLENGIFTQDPLKPEITILNEGINLNFTESILKLFNDFQKFNYVISNGNTTDSNASTAFPILNTITNSIDITTTINNTYLSTATRLSIARTMIHESIHAYLLYEQRGDPNRNLFTSLKIYGKAHGYTNPNRMHHEFMAQYVNAMAYSLYEWDKNYGTGGNLGWDYYYSMAFAGFIYEVKDSNGNSVLDSNGKKVYEDTDSFKELVPNSTDRDNIKKIISDEAEGIDKAKGGKC